MTQVGKCFRKALEDARISIPDSLEMPDWIRIEDIPAICKTLNLKWYGHGNVKLNIEPVIVLFYTGPKKGHAIFMPDIGPLIDRVLIIGVIRLN